jgi:hypothetical protein
MLRVASLTRRRRAAVLGVLAVAALGAGAAACAPAPPTSPVYDSACNGSMVERTPEPTVASNAVTELSGLAASRTNAGVWWGHNDSGNAPKVFAIGDNGANLAEFTLKGATNIDWEDIAVGPGPAPGVSYVYVGDIGGNISPRNSVVLYRFPEPTVGATQPFVAQPIAAFDTLTFTYPNNETHDAEALIADPATGDLFVFTKDFSGTAQIFRAAAPLGSGELLPAGTVSLGPLHAITGADVTAAGDVVALRSYWTVFLYPRPAGAPLTDAFGQPVCSGATPAASFTNPPSPQLESIAFTPDGRGYVTAADNTSHQKLYRFTAP